MLTLDRNLQPGRAFSPAEKVLFGKRQRFRFKGRNQMDSVEGKSNIAVLSCMHYREGHDTIVPLRRICIAPN
jgi:hypothetical protein